MRAEMQRGCGYCGDKTRLSIHAGLPCALRDGAACGTRPADVTKLQANTENMAEKANEARNQDAQMLKLEAASSALLANAA
jgi:hypothetical protein